MFCFCRLVDGFRLVLFLVGFSTFQSAWLVCFGSRVFEGQVLVGRSTGTGLLGSGKHFSEATVVPVTQKRGGQSSKDIPRNVF